MHMCRVAVPLTIRTVLCMINEAMGRPDAPASGGHSRPLRRQRETGNLQGVGAAPSRKVCGPLCGGTSAFAV